MRRVDFDGLYHIIGVKKIRKTLSVSRFCLSIQSLLHCSIVLIKLVMSTARFSKSLHLSQLYNIMLVEMK